MSIHPMKRFLSVPDLVENVFLRLDAGSRKAFFQAHPDVAQNGCVLAHTKLRIELWIEQIPASLHDQWHRVLRLTMSQPPRCLVIAGHNKECLHNFLRCVPEGRHEEKQKVLQGTELQLQVRIRLETGAVRRLQNLMESWRTEEQLTIEDTRVQLVVDLCGRELTVTEGDIVLPSWCTHQNGTLQLPRHSFVRVPSNRVRLEGVVIKGIGKIHSVCLVEVVSGGSLAMESCRVEGGWDEAIRVSGAGACLHAQRSSIQCSEGSGLWVRDGGKAMLEHVTASQCGKIGLEVDGDGTHVSAAFCCVDENDSQNVDVGGGAFTSLHNCSSDGSREDHAWYVEGQGSRLQSNDCSVNNNKECGAMCFNGGQASLTRVTAKDNGSIGLNVLGQGSKLEASDGIMSRNKRSGAAVLAGAFATLSACIAKNNGGAGLYAEGPGSSLVAKSCQAQDNSAGNMKEVSGGCIFCLDVE